MRLDDEDKTNQSSFDVQHVMRLTRLMKFE